MPDIASEKRVVRNLINVALENGAASVSLFDGEEWSVTSDPTGDLVEKELAATDMEVVSFRDSDGERLGQFNIAWGEGPDHVYDHTDNQWCNSIWQKAGLGNG